MLHSGENLNTSRIPNVSQYYYSNKLYPPALYHPGWFASISLNNTKGRLAVCRKDRDKWAPSQSSVSGAAGAGRRCWGTGKELRRTGLVPCGEAGPRPPSLTVKSAPTGYGHRDIVYISVNTRKLQLDTFTR